MESTAAHPRQVATAHDIPTSIVVLACHSGKPVEPDRKRTTMGQREDLSRVGKRHRSLTRRVEGGEQEDEEGNSAKVSTAIAGDVKAEAGSKQSPGHLGEGEEQQSTTTPSVDGPNGGESEEEVDQTESPRSEQGRGGRGAGGSEDSARVEGNNVDCRMVSDTLEADSGS